MGPFEQTEKTKKFKPPNPPEPLLSGNPFPCINILHECTQGICIKGYQFSAVHSYQPCLPSGPMRELDPNRTHMEEYKTYFCRRSTKRFTRSCQFLSARAWGAYVRMYSKGVRPIQMKYKG